MEAGDQPQLSVVIPTRDRAETLSLCLESLAGEIRPGVDEVIVCDDGSTDGTASVIDASPVARRVTGSGSGASSARNLAISEAASPVVLFLDDDIVCKPGLLERHRGFHAARPDPAEALVGLVTWDPSRPISRHMRWLEDSGPLFAFNEIARPENVDPAHFCTANASVKRELLDRVEGPFDEQLRRFTDVELGARLADAGMRLFHDSEAVAWHLRSDDPASTDERMFEVGRASVRLDQVHPGIAPRPAPMTRGRRLKRDAARLLSPLAPILPYGIAGRIWSSRAAWQYAAGREEAIRERGAG